MAYTNNDNFSEVITSIQQRGSFIAPRVRSLIDDEGLSAPSLPSHAVRSRWNLDHLPYLLSHSTFSYLREGLMQRTLILNSLLEDIYSTRRIINAGIIPAEIIFGHYGYIRRAAHSVMRTHRLFLTGTNIIPTAHKDFLVFSDATARPTLLGYALAAKRILRRAIPEIYRDFETVSETKFRTNLKLALSDCAPSTSKTDSPRIALFSPGVHSPYASDDWLIASHTGVPLVQSDDLSMQNGKIVMNSLGEKIPVDVLWHRLTPTYLDPLDLLNDSQLGVPGLVETVLRGEVGLVNHFGSLVLMNPALFSYWTEICQFYLSEDPLLNNVPSFWCGVKSHHSHVRSLIRKRKTPCEILNITNGKKYVTNLMTAPEIEILDDQMSTLPWAFAASQWIEPALVQTQTTGSQGRSYRDQPVGLRMFNLIDGDQVHVFPGGIGTVLNSPSPSRLWKGNKYKDIWVQSEPDQAPVRNVSSSMVPSTNLVLLRSSNIAPRVLNNMFWFGRYIERTDLIVRSLIQIIEQSLRLDDSTTAGDILTGLKNTLGLPLYAQQSFNDAILELVYDENIFGSVKFNTRSFIFAAREIWDQLSYSTAVILTKISDALDKSIFQGEDTDNTSEFPVISDLDDPALTAALPSNNSDIFSPSLGDMRYALNEVMTGILALSGIIAESLVRDTSWQILEIGHRCERLIGIADILWRYSLSITSTALLTENLSKELYEESKEINDLHISSSLSACILRICDSLITARNRTYLGSSLAIITQVVILDKTNPRSLAYNLQTIISLLRELPEILQSTASMRIAESMLEKLNGVTINEITASELQELSHDIKEQSLELAATFESTKLTSTVHPRRFGEYNAIF